MIHLRHNLWLLLTIGSVLVLTACSGAPLPAEGSKAPATERAELDVPPAVGPHAAAAAEPRRPSQASDLTLGPLGLYGQLPVVAPAASSAPGSPDNLRQVTFATEGGDRDPDLDPTGTFLVYASTRHRATADLYLQKTDGAAVTQLTDDPRNDIMPAFSPDGKRLAFASDRGGSWGIYIMDVAGGQPVQLTNDSTQDLHPSFSPDGKRLVYCSFGRQSGQWELVVIDVDKPASKRFIGNGLFPSWAPATASGGAAGAAAPGVDRIVFQRARERGTRWFSIWTIDLVNGEGVRPTEIAASANAACITPRWSPDGKHVVFCTILNPDSGLTAGSALGVAGPSAVAEPAGPVQADVWIMDADGSGRCNLTGRRFVNTQPVWAKDGTIYFTSNRGGHGAENIWAVRPDRALLAGQPGAPGPGTTDDPAALLRAAAVSAHPGIPASPGAPAVPPVANTAASSDAKAANASPP